VDRNLNKAKARAIRCTARLKTGKQCKKISVPGCDFCRVHGFGKVKGSPWYENGIFLTTVSLLLGFLIAWFFFLKSPTPEKQDEILAKQEKSLTKQDETLEIVRRMVALQKENDPELKAKFNLGYVLFTATERKQVIPLNSPFDEILIVDWKSGYDVSFLDDSVTLRLPSIVFHPTNSARLAFNGQSVTVRRRFEPWARPGIVSGNFRLAFKVVSTNANSIVIAMGIQSPPEPRPPRSELMK
jgi:hypothetical protein